MKAAFGTLSLVACLMLAVQCSNPASSDDKRPQVIVDQDITEDTVWGPDQDIIINKIINVLPDAKLIINRGSTLVFNNEKGSNGKVAVFGKADFLGIEKKEITVQCINDCIVPIEFNNTISSNLSFCKFIGLTTGLVTENGTINVNGCSFVDCKRGIIISKNAKVLIDYTSFSNCEQGVKLEFVKDTTRIIHSDFSNCSDHCIEINNYSVLRIDHCVFYNSYIGVYSSEYNDIKVDSCVFDSCLNACTYRVYSKGSIQNTDFINCTECILVSYASFPQVFFNNFIGSIKNTIVSKQNTILDTLSAENNFWDTKEKEDILENIYDIRKSNDINDGYIDFEPFYTNKIER